MNQPVIYNPLYTEQYQKAPEKEFPLLLVVSLALLGIIGVAILLETKNIVQKT
ncbi:MAG: hypothetical protein JST82_13980 [Bacteroidetes bacterium]|nr:hypothetical protein [Bacteroidota bacterium]